MPMLGEDVEFVGPFPVSCDHRCFHGDNSHGCGGNDDPPCNGGSRITEKDIFEKCLSGIRSCDLFFVWADLDFKTAYGTIFEIGIAHALGKQIVTVCHPGLDAKDFWFVFEKAKWLLVNRDPKKAYEMIFGTAKYR